MNREKQTDRYFISRWLRDINNKKNVLIVLFLLILLFAILGMTYTIHVSHEVDELVEADCLTCQIQQSSILCTDFNPCSRDVLSPITCPNINDGNGGTSCSSYRCDHYNLSEGSCCNDDDYCYRDDPLKTCTDGVCRSLDSTLCKGWCQDDSDCCNPAGPTCPFPLFPALYHGAESLRQMCVFHSCVTFFQVDEPIPDPMNLFQVNTYEEIQMQSCYEAICQPDFINPLPACLYQWKCAPFIGAFKKRGTDEDLQITTNDSMKQFPLRGLYGEDFRRANQIIRDALLARIRNNTIL